MENWKPSADTMEGYSEFSYLGTLGVEIPSAGTHEYFEVLDTGNRLVFGGACNVGFLESGYMNYWPDYTSTDEALQELLEDLEVYYSQGREYCSAIVCNDRM